MGCVPSSRGVGVGLNVSVGHGVEVTTMVSYAVGVGRSVGVGYGVGVGRCVGVGYGVGVGRCVGVGYGVGSGRFVGLTGDSVDVGAGVSGGSGLQPSLSNLIAPSVPSSVRIKFGMFTDIPVCNIMLYAFPQSSVVKLFKKSGASEFQ